MLDGDAVETESIPFRQLPEPVWQIRFRRGTQGFDGLPFRQVRIPGPRPFEGRPGPFPAGLQERDAHRVRGVERDRHENAADGMDPDRNPPGTDASPQDHLSQHRVDMDFLDHGNKGTKSFVLSDFMPKFAGFFAGRSRILITF